MLDGVVLVCGARPPLMRDQVNVSVETGLMLRRSGFGHGCVMQNIAGIPSGERSTCAGGCRRRSCAGAGGSGGVTEMRRPR
jgi:hypothetical protein